jgi:enoyl-CoA hydratase/carnithine racemase/3-hydroxyacyl-CoA dehydrogenase
MGLATAGEPPPPNLIAGRAERADKRIATLTVETPSPATWTAKDASRFLKALLLTISRRAPIAVVLTGQRLFNDEMLAARGPDLDRVLTEIASSPTPVIAAIPGDATGQGLELALACSGRVSALTSKFALPDISAGRLPSPQTLEVLPRLVGVDLAVSLVAAGEIVLAAHARSAGLVDDLASRDVVEGAARLALNPSRRTPSLDKDPALIQAQYLGARIKLRRQAPGQTSVMAAVRALEAATLLPRRRVRTEVERIALELSQSEQAMALRYAAEGASQRRDLTAHGRLDPASLARILRWPMLREAIHGVDDGASPHQVDRCFEAYGFLEGPFAKSDRLGLEAVFSIATVDQEAPWIAYSSTLDLMLGCGRRGGPSAPGWRGGQREHGGGQSYPDVESLVRSSAISQRRQRGKLSDETVIGRCLHAAINVSARMLGDNPGLSPGVIDSIWTSELDFPRWKGGPLFQAQKMGLQTVVKSLTQFHAASGAIGAPCEALLRAAAVGHFETSPQGIAANLTEKAAEFG